MAFTEDLSAFFNANDFAVTAVVGATTGKVLLDVNDQVQLGEGRVINTEYKMTYQTSVFTLARSTTLTVDGVSYKVNHVEKFGDGKLSYAYLTKV